MRPLSAVDCRLLLTVVLPLLLEDPLLDDFELLFDFVLLDDKFRFGVK